MPTDTTFAAQLRMSDAGSTQTDVSAVLMAEVPGALRVDRANSADDRTGTDYWVTLCSEKRISVDTKVRSKDFGADDLALETWSVVERGVVGWTRDTRKQTDYVLWLWRDTGRWRLVPFLMLCAAFARRWERWAESYKTATQATVRRDGTTFHSQVVFVPRVVVWRAIYQDNAAGYR